LRRIDCVPKPARWAKFADKRKLDWKHTSFDKDSHPLVPEIPGFYCFVVGLPGTSLPPIGYPLYVGKTERTLRKRFGEYLREQDSERGRVRVRKFIKVFKGELLFFYTHFDGTPDEVKEIETELHDALMPAYSDTGFSAEVRESRNAFQ
ncbi:GIY-YIG nuclease family protein, partial [Xanthomonas axonopodis]